MFFLSSWGWQPACGKMPFLIQKAPLYSEGVAATPSGNVIQPKVRWQTLDSLARFLKSCAKRTPSCTESRRSGSVSYESQIHVKHKYLQGRQEQLVQLLLQLAGILWPSGKKKKNILPSAFIFEAASVPDNWPLQPAHHLHRECSPCLLLLFSPSLINSSFPFLPDSLRRWTVSLWFLCV